MQLMTKPREKEIRNRNAEEKIEIEKKAALSHTTHSTTTLKNADENRKQNEKQKQKETTTTNEMHCTAWMQRPRFI